VWRAPAQGLKPVPRRSSDPADRVACERQLNIIFGAIQEYRQQHGNELPDKLSVLVPEFIHDPNLLVCPFVRTRGGLRVWKKSFADLAHDPFTSYSYEFPPLLMDHQQWRGLPKKTIRDFKERQAEVFGPVVPLVRCHDHTVFPNLRVDGRIYETPGLYWERSFTTNEGLLTVARVFASPARVPARTEFPPRAPGANPNLVDLTAYYNATLTDSWQGFPGNNLAELTPGIHELDGVQFDVRGVIQVRGTEIAADFPQSVAGIRLGQKCRQVHFLHAVSFSTRTASSGVYEIHYADGQVRTIPIHYGRQLADWWVDPQKKQPSLREPRIAWRGENEATKAYGMSLCLYHSVWENLLPDVELATLTLDSGDEHELDGPFCVAITLE
ncbi:MAG TPA: hypothetical protein VNM37_26685, partial [Candidatus Dormibacteraeota bacterium]|nr:hypothetical protein [Candidatus Dormibacteraeota bacterium]